MHGGARFARRGCTDPTPRRGGRRCAHGLAPRCGRARQACTSGGSGLSADRRQAWHQRISRQGGWGAGEAHRPTGTGTREAEHMTKKYHVTTIVNGDEWEYLCEPQQTLLDALRDTLMLTGTKEGCATGDCGACTVMVDGVMICACLMLAVEADGTRI